MPFDLRNLGASPGASQGRYYQDIIEAGKRRTTAIAVNNQDRARADLLIDAGLADTFSEAVRLALSVAVRVVDRISATMAL